MPEARVRGGEATPQRQISTWNCGYRSLRCFDRRAAFSGPRPTRAYRLIRDAADGATKPAVTKLRPHFIEAPPHNSSDQDPRAFSGDRHD
jgi:hypothetical protein